MPATDELVEIMAKALWKARYGHLSTRGLGPSHWNHLSDSTRQEYRIEAKGALLAAIEAGYGIAPPGTWITNSPGRAGV